MLSEFCISNYEWWNSDAAYRDDILYWDSIWWPMRTHTNYYGDHILSSQYFGVFAKISWIVQPLPKVSLHVAQGKRAKPQLSQAKIAGSQEQSNKSLKARNCHGGWGSKNQPAIKTKEEFHELGKLRRSQQKIMTLQSKRIKDAAMPYHKNSCILFDHSCAWPQKRWQMWHETTA